MHTIALVGNPNSGKTTLFNAITGSTQHVGNWPGVTVEKKEGFFTYNNEKYSLVDLPGTYTLGAFSEDEIVARDFVLKGNPEVVINVIDATNIKRNLYLTVQLLEMGANVVLALNMMDEAKAKEINIDINKLSDRLNVPIVETSASKKIGIDELLRVTVESISRKANSLDISYGEEIDEEIKNIEKLLENKDFPYPKRWLAIKILENDKDIVSLVSSDSEIKNYLERLKEEDKIYELEIVDKRYDYINSITKGLIKEPENIPTTTDKVDRVLTNYIFGIPIFALIMALVFQLTFKIGQDFLGGYVETFIGFIASSVENLLVSINAPDLLVSFVSEGFFGGVGAVLVFVPLIVVLYFFLAILEDTGYMARAAYVMDSLMRKVGLQGKSFISMVVGFGCNVPGIMSTRTLDNKKDRMIAILINPFMSCGARLPVYMVFIGAFFPNNGGLVLFLIYALGIAMALIMAKVFSKTLFKGEETHFIMELPPYRLPSMNSVFRDMWEKVWGFLKRAGTVIFLVVTILWVLSMLPAGVEPYSKESLLGRIGSLLAPIFSPAGFGTWQASVSLFAGIAAKEAIVGTLGMLYSPLELTEALRMNFTTLSAISYMVMVLLYTPCAATIATVKRETNSVKWALFMAVYTFLLGYIMAVVVYQIGSLFI
ncbi:ferrous iron transport protein B [Soehngenia longivitae]|uniref:Ferrous iron transport protein B n=1 Tax=Soehngenia longivitae TaxID=2562294 RepID=A0A4Z0D4F7_9FIRM|nr:ferrous iron transport protein B [Soehngenia longivitae]TFZ39214.1 ferrous iron transport protein B [Soehngenia longivitae]